MLRSIQNIILNQCFDQSEQLKQESIAISKIAACDNQAIFDIQPF